MVPSHILYATPEFFRENTFSTLGISTGCGIYTFYTWCVPSDIPGDKTMWAATSKFYANVLLSTLKLCNMFLHHELPSISFRWQCYYHVCLLFSLRNLYLLYHHTYVCIGIQCLPQILFIIYNTNKLCYLHTCIWNNQINIYSFLMTSLKPPWQGTLD